MVARCPCRVGGEAVMTIREQILGMADDAGMLRPDQVHYLVNAHLLPFSDYCEETGEDFSAAAVLDWLGY